MYCVKCGVKLADTEKKCPLCDTVVYHPDVKQADARPLYPAGRRPKPQANPKVFNGFLTVLFSIAILICYIADTQRDGRINWFGIAALGTVLGYVLIALPLWFKKGSALAAPGAALLSMVLPPGFSLFAEKVSR